MPDVIYQKQKQTKGKWGKLGHPRDDGVRSNELKFQLKLKNDIYAYLSASLTQPSSLIVVTVLNHSLMLKSSGFSFFMKRMFSPKQKKNYGFSLYTVAFP